HRVLEAVRMNILPLVKRRLVPHERAQLRAGNVFVWEESECEDGLARWTDGRRWSQSKMRGDCLFYEEKIGITDAEKQAKAARRAMKGCELFEPIPAPPKRRDRPSKVDGLTKQTYRVTVQHPGAAAPKKWHVVAYFTARDSNRLPVVEDYDYLRDIRVPAGVFLNSNNNRPVNGSLEKFPTPLEAPGCGWSVKSSSTQHLLTQFIYERKPESPSLFGIRGTDQFSSDASGIVLPAISPFHPPVTLPPLSSLGYLSPRSPLHEIYPIASTTLAPCHMQSWTICSDDRRILDRFRVVI
ncbi:Gti1/Pac2 family-domain-containing protein, partial [Mycena galericulata]